MQKSAPLVPLAAIRSSDSAAMPPVDGRTELRYFCRGYEPTMLYQLPGPLSWDG